MNVRVALPFDQAKKPLNEGEKPIAFCVIAVSIAWLKLNMIGVRVGFPRQAVVTVFVSISVFAPFPPRQAFAVPTGTNIEDTVGLLPAVVTLPIEKLTLNTSFKSCPDLSSQNFVIVYV